MKYYCKDCLHQLQVPQDTSNPCQYCKDRGNPLFVGEGYWNGDMPAKFTGCIVKLKEIEDRPMWWQNAFIGKEVQAIEVHVDGQHFILGNFDGTAYHKLTVGRGSPSFGHTSIDAHEFIRYVSDDELIKEVDDRVVEHYRDIINDYLQEKDPHEYKKLQQLEADARAFESMTIDERIGFINERYGDKVRAAAGGVGSDASDSSGIKLDISTKIAFKMKRFIEHKVPVRVHLSIKSDTNRLYTSYVDCKGGYNAAQVNKAIMLSGKEKDINVASVLVTQAVPI